MTCVRCQTSLTGRRTKYCSDECYRIVHDAYTLVRGQAGTTGRHGGRGAITDAKLAEVKARFPSTVREWDVAMVEKAWPRLSALLTRRLERLN